MALSSTKKTTISLYGLQISNLVIPLVIIPWLAIKLGIEQFGLYNFVFAIILYFNLLVDYGFNLTSTRDVAMHANNIQKTSEIFWVTVYARFILFLASFTLLLLLGLFFNIIKSHFELYLLAFIGTVTSLLSPTFYFQGLGKLETPSFINLIVRIASLPLIFLYVRKPTDLTCAIALALLPGLIAAVTCIYLIIKNKLVISVCISKKRIFSGLFSGLYPFITSGLSSIYTGSYQIIIGLVLGNSAVATFAVADKIIKALNALITPVSMAVYHDISKLLVSDYFSLIKLLKSIITINLIIGLILAFLIYFGYLDYIIIKVFSNKYSNSLYLLKTLAFGPLIFGLLQISYFVIIALKKEVYMSMIYGAVIIFSLPLQYILIRNSTLLGTATLMISTDFLIMSIATILAVRTLRKSIKVYATK